ncbi:hypothetical protein LZM12_28745, partial [Pseudomonas aeruginosa]|nr:hypothetical protein [Pseudomonas aeruginosa]
IQRRVTTCGGRRKTQPTVRDGLTTTLRSAWLFMRLFVGGVLGFVVGLYFIGALQETPAVFAKIWALSFVVGYAAPKIWVVQERNLLSRIDSSLEKPEKASTGVPD